MIPLPRLRTANFLVRPSVEADREGLYAVARNPLLWDQHNAYDRYQRPVFDELFSTGLAGGGALTFVRTADDRIIGSSRYKMLEGDDVEIGWTFLAHDLWGTGANAELKEALMKHAYQFTAGLYWFVYDRNFRSQRAVEKLGATAVPPTHRYAKPERVVYHLSREDYYAGTP